MMTGGAAETLPRVVLIDSINEELIVLDFDETDWAPVGTPYAITGIGVPTIAALSSTRVAVCDDALDSLQSYDFDEGTETWAPEGNGLSLTNGACSMSALTTSRVALFKNASTNLNAFDYSAPDWALSGTGLNIANNSSRQAALSATDIALFRIGVGGPVTYRLTAGTWGAVGNFASAANTAIIAALSATRVALIDTTTRDLEMWDWDGTDWTQTGAGLNIANLTTGAAVCALSATRVAVIDTTSGSAPDEVQAYEWDDGTETWAAVGNPSALGLTLGSCALTCLTFSAAGAF